VFQRKYDLGVSSYSLLDLPSAKSRIQTVESLWKKTSKYLVLLEQGTNAGFEVRSGPRSESESQWDEW
jgi:ribosomal protein RSM22 (predicted rRNA methylase)